MGHSHARRSRDGLLRCALCQKIVTTQTAKLFPSALMLFRAHRKPQAALARDGLSASKLIAELPSGESFLRCGARPCGRPRREAPPFICETGPLSRTGAEQPVSVTYRTGLGYTETEIGKWRAETGVAKPPVQSRKSGICRPETRARQPNPRECRQFSHSRKANRRDRSGWLGWEDSNSQMSLPTEVLVLRHQLNVLQREGPKRVAFNNFDRLIFTGLYRIAPRVLDALNRQARDGDPLAPCRIPCVLALEGTKSRSVISGGAAGRYGD
jgi:hypothetical protein